MLVGIDDNLHSSGVGMTGLEHLQAGSTKTMSTTEKLGLAWMPGTVQWHTEVDTKNHERIRLEMQDTSPVYTAQCKHSKKPPPVELCTSHFNSIQKYRLGSPEQCSSLRVWPLSPKSGDNTVHIWIG